MRAGGRLQRTGGCRALRTPAAGWRAGLGPVVLTLLLTNQAGSSLGQTAAAQPGPRAASPAGTPDHVLQQRLRACASCARAKRKCDGSRASCELAQVREHEDAAGARARDEGRVQDFDLDAPELANADVAAAYEVRRGKVACDASLASVAPPPSIDRSTGRIPPAGDSSQSPWRAARPYL